jgi:succinoglycan biosynthesis transport protein ExoP
MSLISLPVPKADTEAGIAQPVEPRSSSPIDPLGSVRQHPLMASLIFAGIMAVGIPYVWVTGKPLYTADAVIYVSPTFIKTLNQDKEQDAGNQYNIFAENQARTISRFDICEEALKRLIGKKPAWQKPDESLQTASERLQRSLLIRRVPETYQIIISLSDANPSTLAPVLDSVVDTFLEKSRDEEFYGGNERVKILKEEQAKIRAEINTKVAERVDLAEVLGSVSIRSDESSGDELAAQSRLEFEAAHKQLLEAEDRIAETSAYSQSKTGTPPTAVAELAARDNDLVKAREDLSKRRDDLLMRINDPSVGRTLKDIAKEEVGRIDSIIQDAYRAALDRATVATLTAQREQVELARKAESRSALRLAEQGRRVRESSTTSFRSSDLATEIERLRARLSVVDDRISYLTLEAQSPGFLRVFSRPRTPTIPTAGGRRKAGLVVLGAALLLSLGVPIALVAFDRKIRNGVTIDRILGFPPIGLVMDHQPRTMKAVERFADEQFLRLLSGIDRARRRSGAKLFVLTSVKRAGGTTSIVNRLAHSMKRQGLRIAVVTPTKSVSEYLPIPEPANSQPKVTDGLIERISIPVGDPNSGMFSTNRLTTVFDRLKNHFDLVLVDAPPLMFSAESEILICLCQATLLVVEADCVTKEELTKAAKLLERLRPEATGVILNRVKVKTAGWQLQQEYREFVNGLAGKEVRESAA